MPETTETTEQPDAPTGPVEVPTLFLLSLAIPAVAVLLYIVVQLWGAAERREQAAARRVLEEAGELPEDEDPENDPPDAA